MRRMGGRGGEGSAPARRHRSGGAPTSPAGPHDPLLLQDEGGAVHQAGDHGHAQAQRHGGGAGALRCPLARCRTQRHPHGPADTSLAAAAARAQRTRSPALPRDPPCAALRCAAPRCATRPVGGGSGRAAGGSRGCWRPSRAGNGSRMTS